MQGFKSRLGQLNAEKSKLNADFADSQNQVKALTAERDSLKNKAMDDASQGLATQIETLRHEKSLLEKALAEEKASKVQVQDPDQVSLIVRHPHLPVPITYWILVRLHYGKKGTNCSQRRRAGSVVQVAILP
jgi:hypothetical protein